MWQQCNTQSHSSTTGTSRSRSSCWVVIQRAAVELIAWQQCTTQWHSSSTNNSSSGCRRGCGVVHQ
jgi:hypothetical protein